MPRGECSLLRKQQPYLILSIVSTNLRGIMNNQEIRDTLRQMLKDWVALSPKEREAALRYARKTVRGERRK